MRCQDSATCPATAGTDKELKAMTLESLTQRLAASLALSGAFLLVAALVCWMSVGGGDDVVRSIHNVAGSILAVFGVVFVATGLTLSAGPRRGEPS
jgi:hypothetical protein